MPDTTETTSLALKLPLGKEVFEQLRVTRASTPTRIHETMLSRNRRPFLGHDGRLFIIAADHPARGALGVGSNRMAMANRYELLQRLTLALSHPGVDGVLGTPDIIEDLTLLGALEGKIAVGSMNRGGLRGAVFEMDDRLTGYDLARILSYQLDAAKLLVRVNLSDPGTAPTLETAAHVIGECADEKVPVILEPFMSEWADGRIANNLSVDAVTTSVAIVSGLGSTSAYTWLKLPVIDQMERVMEATTLPTLLLGGDGGAEPDKTFTAWQNALALPGVRGLVVGRTLLYPSDGDVAGAVDTAASLVH